MIILMVRSAKRFTTALTCALADLEEPGGIAFGSLGRIVEYSPL